MTERTDAGAWNFDGFGPGFDEHVAAHLPGYMDVQRLIALIASFTLPDEGRVVDLGASTGRTVELIHDALAGRKFHAVLYDSDASMLEVASRRLYGKLPSFSLVEARLPKGMDHTGADLTLALWLLQFVPPASRIPILAAARARSNPHGSIVVAAKTTHEDVRWQEIAIAALDDYKAEAGVSPEDRAAKTRALRGSMHTVPAQRYVEELQRAGWHQPTVLWRWHVWTVLGASASPTP